MAKTFEDMQLKVILGLETAAESTAIDLKNYIKTMQTSGMSQSEIKIALENELFGTGALFGAFKSKTSKVSKNAMQEIANIANLKTYEEAGIQEYKWKTIGKNICPDCMARNGMTGDIKFFETIGLPKSGFSVCQGNCKCKLVPADYNDEDIVTEDNIDPPVKHVNKAVLSKGKILTLADDKLMDDNMKSFLKLNHNERNFTNRDYKLVGKYTENAYKDYTQFNLYRTKYKMETKQDLIDLMIEGGEEYSNKKKLSIKDTNFVKFKSVNLEVAVLNAYQEKYDLRFIDLATLRSSGKVDLAVDAFYEQIEGLRGALNKLPKVKARTYRGLNIRGDIEAFVMNLENKGIVNWGFTSTSVDESVARKFMTRKNSILFEIEGNGGTYLDGISEYTFEKEVLYNLDSTFEVIKVELMDKENKKYKIKLKYIGNE